MPTLPRTCCTMMVAGVAALWLAVSAVNSELTVTKSLSPRTVETHLGNAYRKLGVRNRVQALARASELGLIRID
jgi:DNA-binding CsgD family transcriptional regulator